MRRRLQIVKAVRGGLGMRAAARRFGVHLRTVQRWVGRAAGTRPDRADLADRKSGPPRPPRRTPDDVERRVLGLRTQLKAASALGEHGAAAIRRALDAARVPDAPSVRTVGRILARHGALDGQARVRRPPPPRGWYLPPLAARRVELDSFDVVEGLLIRGGTHVEVLNGVATHGGLCASWPQAGPVTAKVVVERLVGHWREVGLPGYAQFDNDTVFQGAHHRPDNFGRVTRLCLGLGVTPVFAPPRETGFQAAVESYNGRWQAKVWSRFEHAGPDDLAERSAAYVAAARARSAVRAEAAPRRRPFPGDWELDLRAPLRGTVVFLRRADAAGVVRLLGHAYGVSDAWPHRLVRAEVELTGGAVRFYGLRRAAPGHQPLLREVAYAVPTKRFRE